MATEVVLDPQPTVPLVDEAVPRLAEAAPLPVDPAVTPPRRGSLVDALRAFGVVVGPSIAFHMVTLGSVPALLSRRLRPLAVLGTLALAAYWLVVRPWHLRWGATEEEAAAVLPGDDDVPDPGIVMTRAVTIEAPVERVWPWLAQIGQDRGGFYSYEWLENLAGCRMENAEHVHPEWQRREPGETVLLHPLTGLKVTRFEENHAFGIENWGTYLVEPADGGARTRLIGRSRTGRGLAALFYIFCIEIPHFVMERKMLLGIKERAERSAVQLDTCSSFESRAGG